MAPPKLDVLRGELHALPAPCKPAGSLASEGHLGSHGLTGETESPGYGLGRGPKNVRVLPTAVLTRGLSET